MPRFLVAASMRQMAVTHAVATGVEKDTKQSTKGGMNLDGIERANQP
jgi:hypothetical protein